MLTSATTPCSTNGTNSGTRSKSGAFDLTAIFAVLVLSLFFFSPRLFQSGKWWLEKFRHFEVET